MSRSLLRILVVEPCPQQAGEICAALGRLGQVRFAVAEDLARAREIVGEWTPDLVVAEMGLPDGLATALLAEDPAGFPMIALVGPGSRRLSGAALKAGAMDCVVKSAESLAALPRIARRVLRHWEHIVHRRRAEAQASMLQRLAEAGGYGFGMAELDGPLVFANPSLCRILGFDSEEDILGHCFQEFFPEPELAALENRILPQVRREAQWVGEINMRNREGELRPTLQNIFVLEDPKTARPMLSSLVIDVSGCRLADDALARSERKLRGLFDHMIEGFAYHRIVTDEADRPVDYVFLEANAAFGELTGLKPADIVGRRVREVLPGIAEDPFDWIGVYGKVAMTGESARFERFFEPLRQWFAVRAYSPEARHFAVIVENITERKRTEEELARHRERLEQIVEERTADLRAAQGELLRHERLATLGRLTATVSHELRNPLATIRASHYSLKNRLGGSDPAVDRALARAERNIARCDRIIDELLDFTRSHALKPETTAMDAWASEVLEEVRPPEGVRLAVQLAEGVQLNIDRERLRRCLVNVLDNAFQALKENACSEPEVTVTTRVARGRFEIVVRDNGPGIPPDTVRRVFEPLYSTRSFGLGLGLPIVKRLMQSQGGDIEIESVCGQGTTVKLWLPM